jgi:hypothetical protein
MYRRLSKALLFSALFASAFAAGCASSSPPYSLTGPAKSEEQIAQDHEKWRQQMTYTDEKGHYHPEAAAANRPLRYIPQ